MSFPLFANIVTTILCLAVLVQSVRMMRSLKAVGNDQMGNVVAALDEATAQARAVLSSLKHTLEGDFAGNVKLVLEGREIRDELKMLIEIANSMAERLCDSGRPIAEAEPIAAPASAAPAPAPRVAERTPDPYRAEPEREPRPARRVPAPRALARPMDKDDIAASLAALRAVLSRPTTQKSAAPAAAA